MLREDERKRGRGMGESGSGRQSAMTNRTNENSSNKINTKHKTNIWSKVVTSAQAELKAYLEGAWAGEGDKVHLNCQLRLNKRRKTTKQRYGNIICTLNVKVNNSLTVS